MNRPDEEITKQVVILQKKEGIEGDFYLQVKADLERLEMDGEFIGVSKECVKSELERKVKISAFEFLIDKAKNHSKVRDNMYRDCNGAKHIHNPIFTPDIINILFKFRTHTYLVKNNFRNNYINTNITCPLCEKADDTQEHMFECNEIKQLCGELNCTYSDVFTEEDDKLLNVGKTLKRLDKIRNELLDKE